MPELTVRYSPGLVAVSVALCMVAAGVGLMLADRMRAASSSWQRRGWLAAGSLALGGGIWSMHFLGMLAARLPFPVFYDWRIVFLSALLAVGASAVVLTAISRPQSGNRKLAETAMLMAAGIGGMHFTGMAGMRSRAMEMYNPWLVAASILAAGAFAWGSLAIAHRATSNRKTRPLLRRLVGGSLMGLGIAAMHYTAMAAVTFHDTGREPSLAFTVPAGMLGPAGVAALAALVLVGTLTGASLDEHRIGVLHERNEQLRVAHNELRQAHEEVRQANEDLEHAQDELLRSQASLCEMNLTLSELSVRDGLTGVFNRRYFDRMLESEFRRAARARGPIALLMLDVDHFKLLNDTQGHQQGDACLKQIAEMLLKIPMRDYDVVARYGGEEFVILLPDAQPDGALQKADAIRNAVLALGLANGGNIAAGGLVSVSVGVCVCWPRMSDDPQWLLHEADSALYRAKRLGRNRTEAARSMGIAV